MEIIRDEDLGGIMMIPIFHQYQITRCNIKDCQEKPTTVCVHEQATFGLCENHYQDGVSKGTMKLELEF